MTAVAEEEQTKVETESEENEDEKDSDTSKDRDFSKFRELHKELAEYINEHSGLNSLTPNQVKAVLLLRTDYNNTPEQVAKRAEKKAAREAENKQFEGMSKEQITAEKAARRAEKQVEKLQKRIEEAQAKAQAIREGKEGDGESLAAAVEADQAEAPSTKRTLSRKR